MPGLSHLTKPDTLIVVTFAKAGLGHLRVAYALLEGLPTEANFTFMSSLDSATTSLHRLTSINPTMRTLGEAMQYGVFENLFTSLYTASLRRSAGKLLPQITSIVDSLKVRPKRIVFVSTHFGLAHQLSGLKHKIKSVTGIEAKLAVVVTDDSPQRPWYVPGADIIFVPSELTKNKLASLGHAQSAKPAIEVVSYPLSLKLGDRLKKAKYKYKMRQADFRNKSKIKIAIPVSGAAVGLFYFREITKALHKLNSRYKFFILSRKSAYTARFLEAMAKREYVVVESYEHDRLVVSNYNNMIQNNTIGFEITKPSEQAFKALYTPEEKGGVVLLFSHPVGRQEYDNLFYLSRQGFIPEKSEQEELWLKATVGAAAGEELLSKAENWRGVRLMHNPAQSALFIEWCLREGVFFRMMKYLGKPRIEGVKKIWELVDEIL